MKARPRPIKLLMAAFILALILPAVSAWSGEATNQLKLGIKTILGVISDPAFKGDKHKSRRRGKLRTLFSKYFDFEEMSRRSLARQWRKRTPKEKKEFTGLFSRLMERSYVGKLELYTDEKVKFVKEEVDDIFAKVSTIVVTKKKQEVEINYRMHKTNGSWKVYDIIIEDISLVKNYRDQFRAIIRRTSYADLVKRLQAKRDEG